MATIGSALRDFCSEADELLDALRDGIDLLESVAARLEARPPRLHALFRHAHSLKGLAGMSGQSGIAALAHQLEDVLDALRLGRESWESGTIEWLREACGALRYEIRRAASGQTPTRQALRPLRQGEAGGPEPRRDAAPAPAGAGIDPALRAVLSQYEESRLDFHLRRRTPLCAIRAGWSLELMQAGLHDLLQLLEPIGEVIATVPERTSAAGAEFLIVIAGDLEKVGPVCSGRARVEPLVRAQTAEVPAPAEEDLGHTLRVDVERLDPILSRAGELALEAVRLERALKKALEHPGGAAERDAARRLCQHLATALGQHRNSLLELRMIPIRRLASRLDRTIRDVTRRTGKKVVFHCLGGDTEVDKRIADTLLAALLHLVRNAVDHGIEMPEKRRAAGKPEEGTVTLEATTLGGSVTLRLMDDGRGLEPARLRDAALRLGMSVPAAENELSDLIFEPGFSTAEQVSETSGRGVGLDEVRERVRSLKGVLRARSREGRGMTFELVVPATLAVVPAFLVRSGAALLALPLGEVLESRMIYGDELRRLRANRLVSHGSRMLPVIPLGEVLGLQTAGGEPGRRQPLLVARHPQGDVGLVVDALIGQREVMVRPLPGRVGGHPALHGAAELEGDQVALMLDLTRLLGNGRTVEAQTE